MEGNVHVVVVRPCELAFPAALGLVLFSRRRFEGRQERAVLEHLCDGGLSQLKVPVFEARLRRYRNKRCGRGTLYGYRNAVMNAKHPTSVFLDGTGRMVRKAGRTLMHIRLLIWWLSGDLS